MERADPIVTARRPDVRTLAAGTPVRLYTRSNSRVVAVGTVVDYSARSPGRSKWGETLFSVGHGATAERMVVKLANIHVPGAMASYPDEEGKDAQTLEALGTGTEVLWDAVS